MAGPSHQSTPGPGDEKRATVLEAHGYELRETIGTGTYAAVKVAYSSRHKAKVAIKIISKRKAPPEFVNKFLPRELEVIKILKHPNIIAFLQSIETTNRVYVIMELAENGDLLDIIRREGHVTEYRGSKWFHQLVEAVDYCHSKGVVHRDIKCENILMDKKYNVKLTDFGFAKGGVGMTRDAVVISETFCGSYAYACPEILRGTPYDPRLADIWSIGVVLFVMLYGKLPYDDSNLRALLLAVQRPPEFPNHPPLPEDCKRLIARILVTARLRIHIPDIRSDIWYRRSLSGDGTVSKGKI